jgi:hypothetical protein
VTAPGVGHHAGLRGGTGLHERGKPMAQSNLFWHPPLPMVNGDKKYAIIWTPKVASNIILTWYLRDIGLLYASNFYSDWSHTFRGDFLVKSQTYKRWVADAGSNWQDYKYVKIMRDPFQRSVSSYRHALRFADTRDQVGRLMNIDVTKGFSYGTFLDFLSKLNIRNCDIHFRQQHHPLEDVIGRDRIDFILLDTMQGDLVEILDHKLGEGAAPTHEDDESLADRVAKNLSHITALHHAKYGGEAFGDQSYVNHVFAPGDHKEFPGFERFHTAETDALVRDIYAADYLDMDHILKQG